MKKNLIALTFLMLMCLAPISAYAAPTAAQNSQGEVLVNLKDVDFTITSGIKLDDKSESTFDESRVISGSAEQGSVICIKVFVKNASGVLKENGSYEIEVGVSELFSQTVDLSIGENVIEASASKDGYETVCQEATIRRKSREIKSELENKVVVPATNSNSPRFIFYPAK